MVSFKSDHQMYKLFPKNCTLENFKKGNLFDVILNILTKNT